MDFVVVVAFPVVDTVRAAFEVVSWFEVASAWFAPPLGVETLLPVRPVTADVSAIRNALNHEMLPSDQFLLLVTFGCMKMRNVHTP